MNDDPSFQAFRLLARKRDDRVPGGLVQVFWLAVTQGARQAEGAVCQKVSDSWDIVLVGGGEAVMREARRRGLRNGDVGEV